MALDIDQLVTTMTKAGEGLGASLWSQMKIYALPELRKIATQIVAIEEQSAEYTPQGSKALLDMQIRASIGVIAAMTTLTLLAVQTAINQIVDAVKAVVNQAIGFALL